MSQVSEARLEARALQQVMATIQPMMRVGKFTAEEKACMNNNQNQLGMRAVAGGVVGGASGHFVTKLAANPKLRIPAIGFGLLVGTLGGASTYGTQPLINLLSEPNSPIAMAGRATFKDVAPNSALLRIIDEAVSRKGGSTVDSRASDFEIAPQVPVPQESPLPSSPVHEQESYQDVQDVQQPYDQDAAEPVRNNNAGGWFDQNDEDIGHDLEANDDIKVAARSWDEVRREGSSGGSSSGGSWDEIRMGGGGSSNSRSSNSSSTSTSRSSQGTDEYEEPGQNEPAAAPSSWAEIRMRQRQ
jgi:hypothetical protein